MRRPLGSSSRLIILGTVILLLLLKWTTSQEQPSPVEEVVDAPSTSTATTTTTSPVPEDFVVGTALPVNNTCLTASGDQKGCSFPACEEWVCDQFDSCCEIAWTDTCVETALRNTELCFFIPPPRENNCFTTDPFLRPGCSDTTCEAAVCELAPTCCSTSYGLSCIDLAVVECNLPTSSIDDGGSCFERSRDGGPGCPDDTCLRAVCQQESYCCGVQYDDGCADIARTLGPGSCGPVEYDNTCLETSPVGGCEDDDCESTVCSIRPACCNSDTQIGRYSDACVMIASQSCPLYTEPADNNCFESSDRPGCDNVDCLNQVCLTNDFCCSGPYNETCVETARRSGLSCPTPNVTNSCLETSTFGGCTDQSCEEEVCSTLSSCCPDGNMVGEWSTECVSLAVERCAIDGTNTCFQPVMAPGCSDPRCAAFVCTIDKFCCDLQWDAKCVALASENLDICTNGWPDQVNTCFESDPFQRPGCDTLECERTVCSERLECCTVNYDASCVSIALGKCPLPTPENACFDSSNVPGCTDDICLSAVCDVDNTCCTVGYTSACVDIARQNAAACPPPPTTNSCFEPSRYGGCTDVRCQEQVCEISSSCCNTDIVGEWSDICVQAAKEVCQPEILPRPPGDCPLGMTCDFDSMSNCTELVAQYVDVFDLGEIYGGVYCPEGKGLVNCPVGFYCPDPETILPCPAGRYCPYKTSEPSIECKNCKEGATELTQDSYGYIVLGMVGLVVIIYIVFTLLERHNESLAHKIHELEKRMLKRAHSSRRFTTGNFQSQQKQMLEKLRPKLELIGRRLSKLEETGVSGDAIGSSSKHGDAIGSFSRHEKRPLHHGIEIVGDVIKFDARRVFDILDADCSGDVTFNELNVILGLNDLELKEFIRRMNEMAGSESNNSLLVTRPVFVKYFLQVLTETTNLTISFEEAEALFDEMAEDAKDGWKSHIWVNEVNMSRFYSSSMSEFLSDSQIYDLIKRFKALKWPLTQQTPGSGVASKATAWGLPTNLLDMRKSTAAPPGSLRASLALMRGSSFNSRSVATGAPNSLYNFPMDDSETLSKRRSSAISASSGGQRAPPPTNNTISREEFIEHYPQLLHDIMLEDDNEDALGDKTELLGIDMCFENLSLSIKLGKSVVKVVDNVTGRIRAKSMTAIMGGSGAGKTSLLNALCGRAYYGETSGSILVNGHEESIEDHKDSVGFVPQDDIVYAELTVRENLIFSGRFRLPKGTSNEEIEELADETLANLGLARVANSPVGDVRRRGVSGGERKRVNIGLELMALPSILFLDEPTSGLDASSALLVMKSLKQLAEKDGVTVVSVIHQPRKFIFDLFDSLILLGVGGRMVYHGRTKDAESYFSRLNYFLPSGESMADWLIDISSGRLEPDGNVALNKKEESLRLYKQTNQGRMKNLNIQQSTRTFGPIEEETSTNATPDSPGTRLVTTEIPSYKDETDATPSDAKEYPLMFQDENNETPREAREFPLMFPDETGGTFPDTRQLPLLFQNKEDDSSSDSQEKEAFLTEAIGLYRWGEKENQMYEEKKDDIFSGGNECQISNDGMDQSLSVTKVIQTVDDVTDVTSSSAERFQKFDDNIDGMPVAINDIQTLDNEAYMTSVDVSGTHMFHDDTNGTSFDANNIPSFDDTVGNSYSFKKIEAFNDETDGSSHSPRKLQTFDEETDGTSSSKENFFYGGVGGYGDSGDNDSLRPRTSEDSVILDSDSEDEHHDEEMGSDSSEYVSLMSGSAHLGTAAPGQAVTDRNCVGAKGVTTGKVAQAFEEAKVRRAWLCDEWMKHMANLTPDQKAMYEPPEKYDLPFRVQKPLFWYQFVNQLWRAILVASRNRFSKIIDCTIIVVAVIVITALDGTTEVTMDIDPDIAYDVMVRPVKDDMPTIFQQNFAYALTRQIQYPLKVGIILCVLLGLTATKIVTSKRLEFFRESGSGYNLNAYFFAISILSTLEHSIQVVIAAFFASWIRKPIASNASYYIHFLMLAWITVSWALLIPMVFPPETVTLVAGFFFAFCGLMFSGAFPPIQYNEIYADGGFKEVFAGWISPTRFFYEALTVGEYRCLPEQSGFTIQETSINRETNTSMILLFGYAGHDYNAVRYSCNGWYWSVLPSLLVGFTVRYVAIGAMHTFYRGQQTKKSLWHEMRRSRKVAVCILLYFLVFAGLIGLTTWLFIRDVPFDEPEPLTNAELLAKYGFFD